MDAITENLEAFGYAALFLYSLGGGFLGVIAAGVLAGLGHMNIAVVIAVTFAANTIGDQALFWLGRFNKREIKPYLKKHRRKLALSHLLIKRQGSRIILGQKFVYGLKTLIPIVVGFTKYDQWKFLAYNAIGAAVFAIAFGLGSFYASEFFKKIALLASDLPIVFPIAAFAIIGGVFFALSYATRKKAPGK